MIVKMDTIDGSHGHNAIAYTVNKGKSENREPHPEFLRANFIDEDWLFGGVEPTEAWTMMKLRQDNSGHYVKDPFFRIEICPPQEQCENWSMDDWQKCLDDVIRILDHTDRIGKNGQVIGRHTDLKHSQYIAAIHKDTDNWHIHVVANRITENDEIQDAHRCKERAKMAADAFAKERGWVKAEDRPNQRIENIHKDAIDVLANMGSFSIEDYFAGLRAKGWKVDAKYDSEGICRGYSVGEDVFKPNGQLSSSIRFKASQLKHGRDLTVSRLKKTWDKLHPAKIQSVQPQVQRPVVKVEEPRNVTPVAPAPQKSTVPMVSYLYDDKSFTIPKSIDEIIRQNIVMPKEEDYEGEIDCPDMPLFEDVAKTAAAIFMGYLDAATTTTPTSGGGGGASGGWRDNDDDKERARNAAKAASSMHTPKHSPKRIRRRR